MSKVYINKTRIKLLLHQPTSKVRVVDSNGNHIMRPATEGKNKSSNFVEWMITNAEIDNLINSYLDKKDRESLEGKIKKITQYLKGSKFSSRKAAKEKMDETFLGFKIYKYKEEFYSFEKILDSDISIRLTFKMGDFTLAVHMFVLLPFDCKAVELYNQEGKITRNDYLGSGAYAIWKVDKNDVISIIEGLAHASEKHRDDLIEML